jgi:hypothetical protein
MIAASLPMCSSAKSDNLSPGHALHNAGNDDPFLSATEVQISLNDRAGPAENWDGPWSPTHRDLTPSHLSHHNRGLLPLGPPASAVALDADPPSDSPATCASSIEWGVTYASKYLFHGGFDYSDGKPVLQKATAGWNGLSMQIWSNWDQARREVNELDTAGPA